MDHWLRLARMAWPYRRQVILSLVFGLVAAGLWALELLLTFPMVTVFVEDQTLSAYVAEQVTAARTRIVEWEQELGQVDRRLGLLQGRADEIAEDKRITLLREQSRMQRKMTQDTRKIWLLTSIQPLVDDWLPNDPFRLLLVIMVFLVAVTALKGCCTFLQDLWAGNVAERVVLDLRQGLFRRLLKWDSQSLEMSSPAQLLSALTYDLQGLAHGLTTVGGRVVREPLKAAACLAAAFWVNWQLTALSLVFVPLSVWMFQQFGRRMKRAVQRVLDAMARIYKFLEESFANSRLVLAYGLQGRQRREFHQHNREFSKQSLKLVRIDALTNPTTEVLGMFAVMTGVLPAAYLVLRETTSIGGIRLSDAPLDIPALTAFYALLAGVLDPLRKFSKYFTTIKQCGTAIERTFERWDQPSQIPEPATPMWLPRLETSLEFRNVHFRYATREGTPQLQRTSVLHGISVTIPAGETVAIVGGNGSGKSTLVGLLPRLYDPAEGSVLIDGVDLRSVRLRDLRAQLTLVPQEPVLFDMTIFENIRYGRPQATAAEVIQAAHRAHVLEFAERMPEGLHTRVGDQGRELSGGQRQRVALARAMLRDPRLLILDEPTAAVDARSEQLIHTALADFVRGRTTLIITHHLGAALRGMVDRIIVLDRGRVAAVGQHEELLQTCPIYGRLVESRLPIAA